MLESSEFSFQKQIVVLKHLFVTYVRDVSITINNSLSFKFINLHKCIIIYDFWKKFLANTENNQALVIPHTCLQMMWSVSIFFLKTPVDRFLGRKEKVFHTLETPPPLQNIWCFKGSILSPRSPLSRGFENLSPVLSANFPLICP